MPKKKKIYLYAGYYELYVTNSPMPAPYVLLSTHRAVSGARREAERRDVNVHYAEDLVPEDIEEACYLNNVLGLDPHPIWDTAVIDGVRFAIL